MPPIPAALVGKVAPYTEFKPATRGRAGIRTKRELVVARRAGNTTQLHRVATPRRRARATDRFRGARAVRRLVAEGARRADLRARCAAATSSSSSIGSTRARANPVLLTDATRKNEFAGVTHARDRLLVDSTDVDKTGRREDPTTDLALVDPLDPAQAAQGRDAARHRMGRLHVLVRRPAARARSNTSRSTSRTCG